jgi:Tol biopolymer transport system component
MEVSISILNKGKWTSYMPFSIHISARKADGYIVYRRIMPGYQNWNSMGLYQRNISSFEVETIIDSKVLPGTCVNCHSFSGNDPSLMVFHLRETYGGTMLFRNGILEKLNTRTGKMFANAAFPSWHPSGNFIAFSVNRVNQIFHAAGNFRAAAVDMKSDVFIYDIEKNSMITSPALSGAGKFESFPCFSPDGKKLYYCSADSVKLPQKFDSVRYSLCAVDFDVMSRKISDKADTILSLKTSAKSIALPKVSPDGKFLMFTEADYGCFPSYNPEAELRLLDLSNAEILKMDELNSSNVESWHSWSSEGSWVAFSSRREDGLTSNIYLACIDERGKGSKPFLLPQKDPSYYRHELNSFNVPEFIKSEVKTGIYSIEKVAKTGPALQVGSESGH